MKSSLSALLSHHCDLDYFPAQLTMCSSGDQSRALILCLIHYVLLALTRQQIDFWERKLFAEPSSYPLYLLRLQMALMSFPCTSCSPTCLVCSKKVQLNLSFFSLKHCSWFQLYTFLRTICIKKLAETTFLILALWGKVLQKTNTRTFQQTVTLNFAWLGIIENFA